MGWTLSIFTIVVFGGAIVAIIVGLTALRHRPDPLAGPLAVTMFAVAAWAIPHAIGIGFTDVEQVAFWNRVRYPGTVLAPVAYLVLVLKYAGHERWLSRRTYAELALVPVITIATVWTNPYHGLFWQSLSVTRVSGVSVLVPEFGPWYWVNLGYLYLVTIAALLVLGVRVVRSGPIYRKQTVVMFVGGLVPLMVNGAMNFGVGPDPMVDLTTTALAVSGVTFALALFRFDLLEIRPVARDRLLDELEDGVVVIGPNGRIRDFNPTAARILGDITIDQPAEEVLPPRFVPDGGELVADTATGERRFRMRSTPLTDGRGRTAGRIIYLNDVTDLVSREQRIDVLNRILRHNIRNELNVATGHLELLEDQLSTDQHEHVEAARASTQRVIEFAEKARHVERTLQESDTGVVVSAARIADRIVTDARGTHPDAIIELELPEPLERKASVSVGDDDLFEMAIAELVENAIVHNDQGQPQVTVRVEADANQVQVSIADNGPGIPDHEKEILASRTETRLEHSSGLGLWLVEWTATLSSGELSFTENDPRGTIVTLTLPSGDQ